MDQNFDPKHVFDHNLAEIRLVAWELIIQKQFLVYVL